MRCERCDFLSSCSFSSSHSAFQRGRLPRRKLWGLEIEIRISDRMAIAPSAELLDVTFEQSFSAIRTEAVCKIRFGV